MTASCDPPSRTTAARRSTTPATGSSSPSSGPVDGLECAVDIQRRLARHRREHGFAPTVRIGLHTAEAIRQAGDYRGRGVHVAARIGAAATGEEILVSGAALRRWARSASGCPTRVQLTLKGVDEPVEVRSVDWR